MVPTAVQILDPAGKNSETGLLKQNKYAQFPKVIREHLRMFLFSSYCFGFILWISDISEMGPPDYPRMHAPKDGDPDSLTEGSHG